MALPSSNLVRERGSLTLPLRRLAGRVTVAEDLAVSREEGVSVSKHYRGSYPYHRGVEHW